MVTASLLLRRIRVRGGALHPLFEGPPRGRRQGSARLAVLACHAADGGLELLEESARAQLATRGQVRRGSNRVVQDRKLMSHVKGIECWYSVEGRVVTCRMQLKQIAAMCTMIQGGLYDDSGGFTGGTDEAEIIERGTRSQLRVEGMGRRSLFYFEGMLGLQKQCRVEVSLSLCTSNADTPATYK